MSTLLSADGTTIGYSVLGTGPTVVLVDGAMCFRGGGPMMLLAAALQSQFTVYAYDRRGRGESGNTLPYDVRREVEDIEALLDLAGGAAGLFGSSSGAALVMRAALELGAKVTGIALYEPPFALSAADTEAAQRYSRELASVLATGDNDTAMTMFMTRVGLPAEAIAGMQHSPAWAGLTALAPTLDYDNAVMGYGGFPTEVVAALEVPTLAMAGGDSPPFLREPAEKIAAMVDGARYQSIEGQGHDVAAEAIAPLLAEFFRR